ncbi:hypothetical protein ACFMB7_26350 [Bacillus toyonensis]
MEGGFASCSRRKEGEEEGIIGPEKSNLHLRDVLVEEYKSGLK